jgi:uncharacterized protein (TIGR03435 family)
MKALVAVIAICLASMLWAQTPDTANVAFEVLSVKANKTGSGHHEIGGAGRRWTMTNVPAAGLILTAYHGRTDELIGAPGWVTSESFDIDARATFEPTPEQLQVMLRQLLADRFKLAAHYETPERPIYNLVIARSDGRLGPQLHHVDIDCEAYRRGAIVRPPADPMPCSFRMSGGGSMTMVSGGRTMQSLADTLKGAAGRPVFDKTGLTGYYAFKLEYGGAGPDDLSVFTAVQEQLGLKLEAARGPVEVLVVDHIEHPTEN